MASRLRPLLPEDFDLPDEELGKLFFDIWIMDRAKGAGHDPLNIPQEALRILIKASQELPDDHVSSELDSLFLAVRLAANGKFESAGKKLKSHFKHRVLYEGALNEAMTGKSRQRKNAKKPRPDPLSSLILTILTDNPNLTWCEVLEALRDPEYSEVIDEITDDEIYYIKNGKGGYSAPISGLKDRVSRLKKEINSL